MFITWIAKIIASLNANRRPGEIAAGLSMGVLLLLIPAGNLLWIALLVLTIFLKLNLAIALLVLAIFKSFIHLADPLLHQVGEMILTAGGLTEMWTWLYGLPLLPYTRFNNTVVMGGLVVGMLSWIPVFFLGRVLVGVYRTRIHPRIAESKLIKSLEKIPVVSRLVTLVKHFQGIYSVVA